jgi:penicillin-binding protein 1A
MEPARTSRASTARFRASLARQIIGVRHVLFPAPGTPRSLRTCVVRAGAAGVGIGALGLAAIAAVTFCYIHIEPADLPDADPFIRFEFPAIGHVYDINGEPLAALARESRRIVPYSELPSIVRDAILATEDKRFFSHDGIDYLIVPRILSKVRFGTWAAWLAASGSGDRTRGRAIFPQGGSTITQQLVRGVFLLHLTSQENSHELRRPGLLARVASWAIGARNVNMARRKLDEMRLSLWIERRMQEAFGSKQRAKEEILARYASFVYMGRGQYGFARASEYYLGRPLSTLTTADAEHVALLAGITKAPRDYAPTASEAAPVLRRRNQILRLMSNAGVISPDQLATMTARPLPPVVSPPSPSLQSSAVVEHVLAELTASHPDLGIEDLLRGDVQVYSTVDARIQRIATAALEHGLERYEQRHLSARGVVQGSIVVLRNRDGSILAETGGRQVFKGRQTSYSDFNRVRRSLRQPGSVMKPIVYLAAFQSGGFSLETLVPDEPISVPDGAGARKWIANYDRRFKGPIPVRAALAESRNAVAIWITRQVGIDNVLRTARSLGVETRLQRYPTTALGASEVNLLELATAYRTIASGTLARPYVIRRIVRASGDVIPGGKQPEVPLAVNAEALLLIQEGLRGVVRLPTGTAHALASRAFPVAVMGKTGTTNDFKDALFVGSTYGVDGVTVAVRVGFDDSHSLGAGETGGRVALPIFQEVMLHLYQDRRAGSPPSFPPQMEQRIARYLRAEVPTPVEVAPVVAVTSHRASR